MATTTTTAVPHSFSASGIIQGYHVYQRIRTPHVGEKAGNKHNGFTVTVLEDETLCTFGHMPQEISKKLIRGRVIGVEVTGPRQK